jgi:hypothetical protein
MTNRVKIEKETKAGRLSSWLLMIGFVMAVITTIGYIIGRFGYQLRFSGTKMDRVDLETYIPLLIFSAILVGMGYVINWLRLRKKRSFKSN